MTLAVKLDEIEVMAFCSTATRQEVSARGAVRGDLSEMMSVLLSPWTQVPAIVVFVGQYYAYQTARYLLYHQDIPEQYM